MKQCDFKPISYFGTFARGKSKHRPRNDKALYGGKYPFIQTADVGKADYYITDYVQTYNEKGLAQSKLWPEGTLCITIAANIADTAVLAFPACFPDSIIGFTPYPEISNTRYVKACFDMYKQECRQISQGAAQDNLSWSKLSQIKFPAPPYDVQCKIASVLLVFDNLIEINKKRIELLQESCFLYYSSLNFHGYELKSLFDFGCRLESGRRPSGGIIPSLQNGIPSVGAENVIGLGKYITTVQKNISNRNIFRR